MMCSRSTRGAMRLAIWFSLILIAVACAPTPAPTATLVPPTTAPTLRPSANTAPTSAPASSASQATSTPASAQATAAPANLVKLRVPYTAISVAMSPTWVAYEEGLFKKNGLDVSIDYVATSPVLTAAMLSGEVQIAEAAEDVVITSGLGGSDLEILASGGDRLLFSLYTKPTIKSIQDLKGKTIAVTRRGSSTDFAAHWLLTKNNLVPDKDVAFVNTGGVPDILTAMETGQVDGGVLSPPTTMKAREAGFKELVDISAQDLSFYQAPVVARKSWVSKNPDVVRSFMKAYVEAIAFMKKNKDATKAVIGKYTKTTDNAVLEDSYNAFMKVLPQAPAPQLDAIQVGLDQAAIDNPKAKGADAHQFFDASFVDELVKSGFIAGLYK